MLPCVDTLTYDNDNKGCDFILTKHKVLNSLRYLILILAFIPECLFVRKILIPYSMNL